MAKIRNKGVRVEGKLYKSTQFLRLGFPMIICEEGLPQRVDHMGNEMFYHLCLFHFGEWAPVGWVDPPKEGSEARMPTHTSTACPSSRCIGYVHHVSMLARSVGGIPDAELP